MKKSIIVNDLSKCYICGNPDVEIHHCMYGTANRKLSDKYGLVVPLCPTHHRGNIGVHFNPTLDKKLKEIAKEKFEMVYPYDFKRLFYGDGIEVLDE